MSGVVADTSEWVEYLAGRDAALLDAALSSGIVEVPPIVVAELVSGARSRKDREALVDVLEDIPVCRTPMSHWVRVGDLRRQLRSAGLTVSTPDAHVAQCAIDRDAVLLSRDAIFGKIARLRPLKLG